MGNDMTKDSGKTNKEVTDILQNNRDEKEAGLNREQAAGENKEAASTVTKRKAVVFRPQNSAQKGRPGQGRNQAQSQRPAKPAEAENGSSVKRN